MDNIEVRAELTDVRGDTEIWGQHYSGTSTEIMSLEQQIQAQHFRKAACRQTGHAESRSLRVVSEGAVLLEQTIDPGLWHRDFLFQSSHRQSPGYALAYSGLADVYSASPTYSGTPSENYPKSNAAARKALELDGTLAHPHAVLGTKEMEYGWDFAGGEAEFKRALELDPNDAAAHRWYGWILV